MKCRLGAATIALPALVCRPMQTEATEWAPFHISSQRNNEAFPEQLPHT